MSEPVDPEYAVFVQVESVNALFIPKRHAESVHATSRSYAFRVHSTIPLTGACMRCCIPLGKADNLNGRYEPPVFTVDSDMLTISFGFGMK